MFVSRQQVDRFIEMFMSLIQQVIIQFLEKSTSFWEFGKI